MSEGWICARCKASIAPSEKTCPCCSQGIWVGVPIYPQPTTPWPVWPHPYTV